MPFPSGREPRDLDLEGLNLRWTLRAGGAPIVGSTAFTRVRRDDVRGAGSYGPYGDPYGPYPYGWRYRSWW